MNKNSPFRFLALTLMVSAWVAASLYVLSLVFDWLIYFGVLFLPLYLIGFVVWLLWRMREKLDGIEPPFPDKKGRD